MTYPYAISVEDVRPLGHSSFDVLPQLGDGDIARLQDFYKFELDFEHGYERANPGEWFWKLAGFELKAGPAILQPRVHAYDGALLVGAGHNILLYLSWPGAEPFPVPVDPPYAEKGVGGFTEGKGSVGWGFGSESHIGDDGGPYTVWVSSDPPEWEDRRIGSDAVHKLGWWDEHIIPNPIFQVWKMEGGEVPSGTEYLVNLDAAGSIVGHITWLPGMPLAGKPAIGLMRAGVVIAHVPWQV